MASAAASSAGAVIAPSTDTTGRAQQADHVNVTVVACGTRGDVEPVLCVALALLHASGSCCSIQFVTHAAHKVQRHSL